MSSKYILIPLLPHIFHLANPNSRVSIRAQQLIQDITSPNILSFNINLNLSLLILNFDEPINSTSFSFTSFTFQNTLNIIDGYSYISLTNGTVLSSDGIQITVLLNPGDVNSIKQLDSLFINLNSSFISHTNLAFFDLSGNAANPIFNNSALKASMYLSDTVRPILMCYSLDMNTGLVLLTFNEIVNLSSIHFPSLSFQRLMDTNGDISQSHSLSETSYLNQTENDIYVSFVISEPDLNTLKSRLIATSTLTTFLSINSLFISDMNYNYVFPLIDGGNVLSPCSFLPDISPPSLFSFSLDLNSSYIILTFTETTNLYSLRPSFFILSSSQINGVQFVFSISTMVINPINDIYATLGIALQDSNEIKRLTSLAISLNSTFLYYIENAFSDVFSNIALNRSQSEAIPAHRFISDQRAPIFEKWQFDLDSGSLQFFFDETIDTSTFKPSTIFLSDQSNLTLSSYVVIDIDGGSISANSATFSFNLSLPDLNEIKMLPNLCFTVEFCFIHLSNITDMNSNLLSPITLQSSEIAPDITNPKLNSFSLDMNSSILTLFFSETVNSTSFQFDGIILGDLNGIFEHRLNSGSSSQIYSPIQEVLLSDYDVNLIKENTHFGTSVFDTFLRIDSFLIRDMSGNYVDMIINSSRLQCADYIPDEIPPVILSTHLDMNTGTIQFIFSEPVIVYSFRPIEFVFQNDDTIRSTYRLTSGQTTTRNWTHIEFDISLFDLNNIKRDTMLASNLSNSYYTYGPQLVSDVNLNRIFPSSNYSFRFSNYTPDTTSPRLISFSIDLMKDYLLLSFNEPVIPMSLDPTELTIIHPLYHNNSYSLASSVLLNSTVSTEQIISLVESDRNQLKRMQILSPLTASNSVLLFHTQFFVNDTNNNRISSGPVPPIPILCLNIFSENCSQFFYSALNFTVDTNPPFLTKWDLNLTSEEIHLFFSDAILAESFNISNILLQNTANFTNTSSSLQFSFSTDTTVSSLENGPDITLRIGINDLNKLKSITNIGTCLSNDSYLSLAQGAITDLFDNVNTAVPNYSALMVTICFPDITPPYLTQFNLFFTGGKPPLFLQLIFSETINTSSLNPTQFTFGTQTNFSSDYNSVYTLTGGSFDIFNSDNINISVIDSDLSAIRDLNLFSLGIDRTKTFLAFTSALVNDMQNNNIIPISNTSALMITNLFADLKPPELMFFDLDLSLNTLSLFYTEQVLLDSFIPNFYTLHSSTIFDNGTNFQFTQSDSVSSFYLNRSAIIMNIIQDDFNQISNYTDLATSSQNTFISQIRGAVIDVAENEVLPILQPQPLQVRYFLPDTVIPKLLSFSFDLDMASLFLTFSETVDVRTINFTQFTLQNDQSYPSLIYPLSGGTTPSPNGPSVTIIITYLDLNNIKAIDQLADSNSNPLLNTFLAISPFTVKDMNMNFNEEIRSDTMGKQVNVFYPDVTRPELLSAILNLNDGSLTLIFSETIRESTLDLTRFTLQDNYTSIRYS
ncbi:hypothetical protein LOD99_2129 [Oopsacas minuta]|uniref:Uncharacterized protein n=1 Tax=Oopsacas minuta TaxID=111878 RepID=A0AAV7K3V5_9METZ|nr:hypothetical protein LOD99_2129 [Oopsacas minuta]